LHSATQSVACGVAPECTFYSNHIRGNVYEHELVCAHASNEYEHVHFLNRHCVPTACEKVGVILLDLDAVSRNLVLDPDEAIEKSLTNRCQLLGCVAVAKRDDCVKTIVCRRLHSHNNKQHEFMHVSSCMLIWRLRLRKQAQLW
jgi:hypothetical protein